MHGKGLINARSPGSAPLDQNFSYCRPILIPDPVSIQPIPRFRAVSHHLALHSTASRLTDLSASSNAVPKSRNTALFCACRVSWRITSGNIDKHRKAAARTTYAICLDSCFPRDHLNEGVLTAELPITSLESGNALRNNASTMTPAC